MAFRREVVAPHADGPAAAPAVSPDGTRVAYVVDQHHVGVAPIDGRSWPVLLSEGNDFALDPAWSPDGARVAWHEWDVPAMPWDASRIVVRSADGAGSVEVVAGGAGIAVAQPRWSASGRLGFLCDAGGWLNVHTTDGPLVDEAVEHGPAGVGPRDPHAGAGRRTERRSRGPGTATASVSWSSPATSSIGASTTGSPGGAAVSPPYAAAPAHRRSWSCTN